MLLKGTAVIFLAPNYYREPKIGLVYGPCKDHDDATEVLLLTDEPIKKVCVKNNRDGDSIKKL
jgi:hypothetical protein